VLPKEFHYTSFAEAMSLAQDQEPARTYWVNSPQDHPFHVLGLYRLYKNRYPILWRPVFDPVRVLWTQITRSWPTFRILLPAAPRFSTLLPGP
jgi:hypothetical protein